MLTSGPSLSAAPVAASTSCAEILVRLPDASTLVEMVAKAACRPLQHASGHQCDVSMYLAISVKSARQFKCSDEEALLGQESS